MSSMNDITSKVTLYDELTSNNISHPLNHKYIKYDHGGDRTQYCNTLNILQLYMRILHKFRGAETGGCLGC